MALDGLEKELRSKFPKHKGKKVNFIRYADDWIITGVSKALLEQEIIPLAKTFLEDRGLELSPEKTKVTHIDDGFDFLGQNIRKYKGKLLIKPSKDNVRAFLSKVREVIKSNPTITAGELIRILNPKIRGWAQYHKHVVSKATYNRVDHMIFQALRRWTKRRHRNKSCQWIKSKYFKTVGGDNWVFFGENEGKEYILYKASSTPIQRHIKIKREANPFDAEWETYFKNRNNRMRDKPNTLLETEEYTHKNS
jgi:RNA-directed DNA polymerase